MAMDTAMGGDQSRFPSTQLSLLFRTHAGPSSPEYLERVVDTYWKPIYCYVRRAWSKSDADAKDLTQSFFVHLLQSDVMARFDRERGNFRTYLKQCLRHFLSADSRDRDRIKRGGTSRFLPLDAGNLQVPDPIGTPEEQFDRDWAAQVLELCRAEAETQLRAEGKSAYVDAFRLYSDEPALSYREVGERLGLGESDVRNYLRHVRQKLRQLVIATVSSYVSHEDEILAELGSILGEP